MTVTDAQAAHAWAQHRKLNLEELHAETLGQLSRRFDGPIPAYVMRTLARICAGCGGTLATGYTDNVHPGCTDQPEQQETPT